MATNALLAQITDLGDSAVLLLLVMLTSIYLWFFRCRRAVFSLWLAFGLAGAGIACAKLLFLGCIQGTDMELHSPSGHTALSLAVYGMMAILLASQFRKPGRILIYVGLYLLIAIIAWSRVALTYHSTNEVIAGLLIGGCGVFVGYLYLYYRRSAVPMFNPYLLIVLMAAAAFLLHGTHLPAEAFLRQLAANLKTYIPACGSSL